ncbi:MAG TPA: HlyD family efflux transporter periplasmic adaptor subunit, partial [Chloroflexota bacterium]|nr:HlyD family efflux transporter periplasmic adaptor subunit [Chloroflexota bacterium]
GVEAAGNALTRARASADPWEVRQAQLAVEQAQANLAKLKAPAAFDVEQAQAAVEQARANVDKLAQAARTDVQVAEAAVHAAEATLARLRAPPARDVEASQEAVRQAEAELDKARRSRTSELALARAAAEQAHANLERLLATRPFEVEIAHKEVERARAQLRRKQAGPSEADLEAARARVAQAETALLQAREHLMGAALVAPFEGTITEVSVRAGEQATAATPVVTLADLESLHVETRDLDESGAARIEAGQPVRVTVHALERTLPAKVTAIAPQGTATPAGDTTFTANIAFDRSDPALRWGQTVKVEFGA